MKLKIYYSWFICCTIFLSACATYKPTTVFQTKNTSFPDYSNIENWAAHPSKFDPADLTPEGDTISQENMVADVFFLHPTTYTGDKKGQNQWNGPMDDNALNEKTNSGTIKFQASAFNQAGRVFAPRYRQAHLNAYFTKDTASARAAFDLAYRDIKSSFEYYLKNENHGRPFILASHSQGTTHAIRLINEFINSKPLKNKLVAAYLIGMPVRKDQFTGILPCSDSLDTSCFVSWRTFKEGHEYKFDRHPEKILVTNPINWKTDDTYAPKSANKGTLLFDFNKIYNQHIDAQVHESILWANKPKFKGSIFLRTKNYHPADINFYYFNIRENASLRVAQFIKNRNQ